MNKELYIAVDPGKNGAWVAMNQDGEFIDKMVTPRMENNNDEVDIDKEIEWLWGIVNEESIDKVYLIVEDVHPLPGVGAASTGKFMENKGQIEGIFHCAKTFIMTYVEVIKIAPQAWQKAVWDLSDRVYKASRTDTKATSLNAAKRIWPDTDFRATSKSRSPHDGIVDAALIAEAVRRRKVRG